MAQPQGLPALTLKILHSMAKTTKPKAATGAYTITLEINDQKYVASGATVDLALLALPKVQPKTRAVFVITHAGKSSRPMMFSIMQFKRLFFPGMTGVVQRSIFARRYKFFS